MCKSYLLYMFLSKPAITTIQKGTLTLVLLKRKCHKFPKHYKIANCRKMSEASEESTWRGVPITQIYGAQSPWGAPEFPLVRPSSNHTVLYHIPSDGLLSDTPPKPQVAAEKDLWDQHHVRLPCSSHSLYPVENASGETKLKKRWGLIQAALSKPIRNSQELIDAILSYNTKFKDKWRFKVLHKLFNKYLEEEESRYFFDVTLPQIIKLALDLPKLIQAPIPLLKQHKNQSISLSQQQIASLLANAFFCTFPRRNSSKKESEYSTYPVINFSRLYESSASKYVLEKMKCICHYFRRVCTKAPCGVVTFSRRSVPPRKCPDWAHSTTPLATLPVHTDSEVFIEHADGLIQVDFANRFLGGGVLGHGCVQEEIRFIICPELIASMIFVEEMRPNEAVMIIGVEQYSEYTGYGNGFEWAGNYNDTTPMDSSSRRRCAVLAIDALSYSRNVHAQYDTEKIDRELNKAWVGFSFLSGDQPGLSYPGVATGNWGCGVYRGSPYLKSLLQMMACAEAGRPMAYYTFGDLALRNDIVNMYNVLSRYNVTVGQLYGHILQYCAGMRSQDLHTFLTRAVRQDAVEISDSEEMDISTATDTQEVISTEERTLDNRSPDLFSQNSSDQSQKTKQMFFTNTVTSKESSQDTDKMLNEVYDSMTTEVEMCNDNKIAGNNTTIKSDETNEVSESKVPQVSQTSRLFEEMEKLDESSGNLRFNTTNTSLFDANTSSLNNSQVDNETKIQIELSSETKKKLTGKITDYFSKKRT
ncbi:poly(ADP-ribose) glycohydrolase-like [Epargyreus clarus]|uniref:poly(ADP-ribose) glycohydrolase-like n=1 Tax=Epargyreus clarus TaxID=520877 RepID=UPI003C2E5183